MGVGKAHAAAWMAVLDSKWLDNCYEVKQPLHFSSHPSDAEPNETLSTSSGDTSSVYSDEQVAKAPRLEEPTSRPSPPPPPPVPPSPERVWSFADAASLYNVPGWSEGYFEVLPNGQLAVKPQGGE